MKITEAIETIVGARAGSLPAIVLAEVLDRLIWCIDNNGEDIIRLQLQWFKGNDDYRAEIALAMSEAFPFSNVQEARDVLAVLQKKWPHLSAPCNTFPENWQKELRGTKARTACSTSGLYAESGRQRPTALGSHRSPGS